MKYSALPIIICFLLWICSSFQLLSQAQLIVTYNNNNTESFALDDIRSLKFESQWMVIRFNNGEFSSRNVSTIANYQFFNVSGIFDEKTNQFNMSVYPNPSNSQVFFSLTTLSNQFIFIEVLDLFGRVIKEVYKGDQLGYKEYSWMPDVSQGTYFVRLKTNDRSYTQTLILQ